MYKKNTSWYLSRDAWISNRRFLIDWLDLLNLVLFVLASAGKKIKQQTRENIVQRDIINTPKRLVLQCVALDKAFLKNCSFPKKHRTFNSKKTTEHPMKHSHNNFINYVPFWLSSWQILFRSSCVIELRSLRLSFWTSFSTKKAENKIDYRLQIKNTCT